jgi:methionyl-tRNA formyltransferase
MHTQPTIAFFGTPELCLPILDMLAQHGFSPALVITNPDRPVGRKFIMTPPPVKVWAQEHTIPVLQPEKLDSDFKTAFETYNIDLSIVVAYGKIMPNWLIEMPKYQTLNIHYSLLPKYRGASPVESALLHGETETGVCIQKMVHAMDAGPLVACETILIEPNETHEDLRNRLNVIGAQMLVNTIPEYIAGNITPTEQVGEPSYCYRTEKSDGEVNLKTMSPVELWNRYRAYHGWPGIFFFETPPLSSPSQGEVPAGRRGIRIKITQAHFSEGKFIIEKVIPEGKSEIDWKQEIF